MEQSVLHLQKIYVSLLMFILISVMFVVNPQISSKVIDIDLSV